MRPSTLPSRWIALRGVLVGVAEDAEPVELRGFDELQQLFEIRFGLAGESDDEAGADRDARNRAPDLFEQLQEDVAVRAALHALQHGSAGVLQRHIDVLHERIVLGERFEQLRA